MKRLEKTKDTKEDSRYWKCTRRIQKEMIIIEEEDIYQVNNKYEKHLKIRLRTIHG